MSLNKDNSPVLPRLDLSQSHRILILGDSITFIGHYITYIEEFLKRYSSNNSIVFYPHGRSGENISGLCEVNRPVARPCLYERLEDVLQLHDDITDVIFFYGMNDGIYEPFSEEYLDAYKNGVNRLVNRLNKMNVSIIAMTPTPFDAMSYFDTLAKQPITDGPSYPIPYKGYDDVLQKYTQWLMQNENDGICHTIDLHTPLKSYIDNKRQQNPAYQYGDGIHPGKDGHYLMAATIIKDLFNLDMSSFNESTK